MPRPRKTTKFAEYLGSLNVADLKQLKTEVAAEIRTREREIQKGKDEEQARKMRDKIKIGQKITFSERGAGGGSVKAEVIGIFTDSVQVEVNGRRRSIALTRLLSIN